MSQYQKGKTNLDFIEARDSKWQWHQLSINLPIKTGWKSVMKSQVKWLVFVVVTTRVALGRLRNILNILHSKNQINKI